MTSRTTTRRAALVGLIGAGLAAGPLLRSFAQAQYSGGVGFPYNAFDALPKIDLDVSGRVLRVAFAPGEFTLPRPTILDWVAQCGRAVATYYGRFPVEMARILIIPVPGRGILRGQTWGYRGGAIRVSLGTDSMEANLQRDWVMVHEMVHLALPDMDERHNWLSEGLAVYVEPIARAQAGQMSDEYVWHSYVTGMPKGLPEAGDRGFDNTPTWGRTYWGGAMFCLIADIDIRKRAGNRLGLQQAMRGMLAVGGNHEQYWPIRRVLAAADAATGLTVLGDLYEEMRGQPIDPNLERLWRDLGVRFDADRVSFDDTAPLASIRAALTAPPGR